MELDSFFDAISTPFKRLQKEYLYMQYFDKTNKDFPRLKRAFTAA